MGTLESRGIYGYKGSLNLPQRLFIDLKRSASAKMPECLWQ
jgi:hypothetical protein